MANTPHDPIYIGSDLDFTAPNGVTNGSGTAADPYIIDNWDIDTGSTGNTGIQITGTFAHFVIRNVTVFDSCFHCFTGIQLDDVQNGTIANTTIDDTNYGIYLYANTDGRVTNITINDNRLYNVNRAAIRSASSTPGSRIDNISVENNQIDGATTGIRFIVKGGGSGYDLIARGNLVQNLSGGDGGSSGVGFNAENSNPLDRVEARNNTIRYTGGYGMWIEGADNALASGNLIDGVGRYGIVAEGGSRVTTGNRLQMNTINDTGNHGIYLGGGGAETIDANVTDNVITNSSESGIYAYRPMGHWILRNVVRNTVEHGIYVFDNRGQETDTHLRVGGNDVSYSNGHGVYFSVCCDRLLRNEINGNHVWNVTGDGVNVYGFVDGTIAGNVIWNATSGIWLGSGATSHTSDNLIAWNDVSNNSMAGIYLNDDPGDSAETRDNRVTENLVHMNMPYGIKLSNASDNRIDNNSIWANHHGVHLESSSSNEVASNALWSNDVGIHLVTREGQNPTSNNLVALNSVSGSTMEGLLLQTSSGGGVIDNNISGNVVTGNSGPGLAITNTPVMVDLITARMGQWSMNESTWTGTPGEVLDSSGGGNHGFAVSGASTTASGRFDRAGLFDGVDDFVTVPDSPALQLPATQTVSAWVNASADALDWVRIVGKGGSAPRNYGLWRESDGDILYQIFDTTGTIGCSAMEGLGPGSPGNAPVGTWTHVAGTYDGVTVRLYVNGDLVATSVCSVVPASSLDPMTIGFAGFHTYLSGKIDEVQVFSRTLSAPEVLTLAMRPFSGVSEGSNTVWSNNVTGNGQGVFLNGSANNTISSNLVSGNTGYGAHLVNGSRDNLIFRNNFDGNNGVLLSTARSDAAGPRQANDSAGPNRWNETYSGSRGNWWSDWTIPDDCDGPLQTNCGGNPDGVVDSAYTLDGSAAAKDFYPLTTFIPGVPETGLGAQLAMVALSIVALLGLSRLPASRRSG